VLGIGFTVENRNTTPPMNERLIQILRQDIGFVFLGVYRLDCILSDESHFVWERILEECDLSRIDYLESLRN